MIKEGKFVEDEFDLTKRGIYGKDYGLFEFQLLIREYPLCEPPDTFLEDLKEGIENFAQCFPFIKLGKLQIVGSVFAELGDPLPTGKGLEVVYETLERYSETKLIKALNEPDPEEVLDIFFALEYQNTEGETCVNDQHESVLFSIEKTEGGNQLVCDFRWGSGAEWFYNKHQKENRELVRKAIVDFYESSPKYQELKISYYLYLFDLEIERHTSKNVIARKNNGVTGN